MVRSGEGCVIMNGSGKVCLTIARERQRLSMIGDEAVPFGDAVVDLLILPSHWF